MSIHKHISNKDIHSAQVTKAMALNSSTCHQNCVWRTCILSSYDTYRITSFTFFSHIHHINVVTFFSYMVLLSLSHATAVTTGV